jgi:hypothetical protein
MGQKEALQVFVGAAVVAVGGGGGESVVVEAKAVLLFREVRWLDLGVGKVDVVYV